MPNYRILFFATLREASGVKETEVELPAGATVGDLKEALVQRFPDLKPHLPNTIVAFNYAYAFDEDPLPDAGGEVALFPPVSGGSGAGETIRVTVIFFAALRAITGHARLTLELPKGATVGDLKRLLLERWPELKLSFDGIVVSIGEHTAEDDEVLPDGAQVGFFHPIAGGSEAAEGEPPTICLVLEGELDTDALIARIVRPTTGAVVSFTGVVRAVTRRDQVRQTERLEYEAYRPMAEAKMRQIAEEIRARWPEVEGIALVQRIGVLTPGTPTTFVACAAPHRNTGVFEAARYGIDRLKEIVPIWKKEVGPNGEAWVEGHYRPQRGD